MKTILLPLLTLAAALTISQPSFAADLGDAAAPLQIEKWVQGGPVDMDADTNKIYVVEFWATWCPPCLVSIPHLTEIQKEFKDKGVVVIGISDETASTVNTFIRRMGDKMHYIVGLDKELKTTEGYMNQYGVDTLPYAFIVRHGQVIWRGRPMTGLEDALKEIVNGTFNLETTRKRVLAREELEKFTELAMQGAPEETLAAILAQVEELDREIGGIEPGRPFSTKNEINMVKFQRAAFRYQKAVAAGFSGDALDTLADEIKAVAPEGFVFEDFRNDVALWKTFMIYFQVITGKGDTNALPGLTKELEQAKFKSARPLSDYAWAILTDESVQMRDLVLATKLAKAAVDASDSKSAGIIDTYARALFDSGDIAGAVHWQKKAVAVEENDEMRMQLEATLQTYEKKAVK